MPYKELDMAKLQDEIASTFLQKLSESSDVTPELIERLRALLSAKKDPKADDLVDVFSPPTAGDVE